jgi:hypothetical protein
MSPFEVACWNFYQRELTAFAFEAGLVAHLIKRLGLKAERERIFLRAMNIIRQAALIIYIEDARK